MKILLHVFTVSISLFFSVLSSAQQPLGTALSLDGKINPGVEGSFSAEGYQMILDKDGEPIFLPTTEQWNPIGIIGGGSDQVRAIAINGDNVYVGGLFGQIGALTNVNFIARWNITTRTWNRLGTQQTNGTNAQVNALVISGGFLYVGGAFTSAGGVSCGRVARYNLTSGAWSALGGSGFGITTSNGQVHAMAAYGGDIWIGGQFNQVTGPITANNIVLFRPSLNIWNPIGAASPNGTNSTVFALTASSSDIYVGGNFGTVFNSTTGAAITANRIARWNPTNGWRTLGNGVTSTIASVVYALALQGSRLYVGGQFQTAGTTPAENVAQWTISSETWGALGNGVNLTALSLWPDGRRVFVGGSFITSSGDTLNRIAVFDTLSTEWRAFGRGANNDVLAIAGNDSLLFAGGRFTTISGTAAGRIAELSLKPVLSDLGYSIQGPNTYTITATVNPTGLPVNTAYFEYSSSPTFASNVVTVNTTPQASGLGSGYDPVSVSVTISPSTSSLIYFRLVARNARGLSLSSAQLINQTPAPIPRPGLVLWYRADSLITRSDTLVSTWGDLSGNGNNAVSTGAQRPSFVSSLNAFGNREVIRFAPNGSQSFGFPRQTRVRSVFMMARSGEITSLQFLLGDTTAFDFHGGSNGPLISTQFSSPAVANGRLFFNGDSVAITATRPTTPTVIGLETTANTAASTLSADRPPLGNTTINRSWRGEIAEVILYDRVLTSAERAQVTNYLRQRYKIGIPILELLSGSIATDSSLSIRGLINPNGLVLTQTGVEYTTDSTFTTGIQFVSTTPSAASIGSGSAPVEVTAIIPLQLDTRVYYRLTATYPNGTEKGITNSFFRKSFPPASVPNSGLLMWLRADSEIFLQNGVVTSWGDRSGNGRTATATTTSPGYSDASSLFNSQPVLIYNNAGSSSMTFQTATTIRSVFFVGRSSDAQTLQFLLGDSVAFDFHAGSTTLFDGTFSSANLRGGSLYLNGTLTNIVQAQRPTTPTIISLFTSGNVRANRIAQDRTFGNRSWRGEIAEVILFNRTVTFLERMVIEAYLSGRYHIGRSTVQNPVLATGAQGLYKLGETGAFVTFTSVITSPASMTCTRQDDPPTPTGPLPSGIAGLAPVSWTLSIFNLTGYTFALTLDLSSLPDSLNRDELVLLRRANASAPWTIVTTEPGVSQLLLAQRYAVSNLTSGGEFCFGIQSTLSTPHEKVGLPRAFALSQNYPNPFNPSTRIAYQLPTREMVTLEVFDMLGRQVSTLVNQRQDAGRYEVTFNALPLSSGVYFYRLQAGSFAKTMKMTVVK